MPKRTEYQKTLAKLAAMLRKQPMTAREIAEVLGCCKPAAYQRIRALQSREQVYTIPRRESVTGPKSIAYGIRSA